MVGPQCKILSQQIVRKLHYYKMNYSKRFSCCTSLSLEQYMITFSSLSCTCDSTAPIAQLLATISTMYGTLGSGYASTGVLHNASLSMVNAFCCLWVHVKWIYFLNSSCREAVITVAFDKAF